MASPGLADRIKAWFGTWMMRHMELLFCIARNVVPILVRGLIAVRAVRKHVTCKWALRYIERWLTAPMEQDDGTRIARTCGTPQGGVISPILSNLFMHYTFDLWMTRTHPDLPWCRYADDGLVHCRTEQVPP